MAQILVVDDESEVLGSLRRVLENAGHSVTTASNGREALKLLENQRPELVVLDIIMPEMSGLEVCRHIRGDPFLAKIPVIFLTAKSRPSDVTQGLDAGGDDYITKPFDGMILPARVRALLRRSSGGTLDVDTDVLVVRDLKLHNTRLDVQVADRIVELTRVEHHLLHYLMVHAGQPVSVAQLLEHVWEYPSGTGDPTLVYVHIKNLRAKIDSDPEAQYIRNVHGRGYVIDN